MSSMCNGTPDEYLCPITREIMRDPVIAAGEATWHVNIHRMSVWSCMDPALGLVYTWTLLQWSRVFCLQMVTRMNGRLSRAGSTQRTAPVQWPTCLSRPPFWHQTELWRWPSAAGPLTSDHNNTDLRPVRCVASLRHMLVIQCLSSWLYISPFHKRSIGLVSVWNMSVLCPVSVCFS